MTLTIATWNINSVRLRLDQVTRLLREQAPDVLCLQEIKCMEAHFPGAAFADLGYRHIAIAGQKGYDVMTWYCIGLVVGPLGLGTLLLPQQERRAEAVPLR